jgi:hypothetical protein
MIEQYLEDLENRIDPNTEQQLWSEWQAFLNGEVESGFFCPNRLQTAEAGAEWPCVSVNEALVDPDRMLLQQMAACSAMLAQGSGSVMCIRTNYGTGIMPSVFGAEPFAMEDELNTLPTSRPLEGGADTIQRLLDAGVPDVDAGLCGRCLDTAQHFISRMKDYPKITRYVHIYHPDLQGPMDIAELLWGSDIFMGLVDNPELAHGLLELVTETYTRFMKCWEEIVPPQNDGSPHWNVMHKGRLMLRDDSAMNLSPDMFEEFIKPYDQELLCEFGGGAIHFCGRGDHYIHHVADMDGVYAVNMSQPECNDMERIFQHTVDKGIALVGLRREAAEEALRQGRDLRGWVQST